MKERRIQVRPPDRGVFPEIMQDYAAGVPETRHAAGMIVYIEKYGKGLPSYNKKDRE